MVRENDHLFQAEVLFYYLHVNSEGHKASEYKRWSEKKITCSKLKSFSTLCMLLVRIIRVVNIRLARAKDHLFQSEVLLYHLHVTSEGHKDNEYKRWSEKKITCSKLSPFLLSACY